MSESNKKPWKSPTISEMNIKLTENNGGLGMDIAFQDDSILES